MTKIVNVFSVTIILMVVSYCPSFSQAQEFQVTGVYQGSSLYIQNPYIRSEQSFCILEITLNNKPLSINYGVSALDILFEGFELFTPVTVRIKHKPNCQPIILNPESIRFHSTFGFREIAISDSALYWRTRGEKVTGGYEIQRLYSDSWETLDAVQSQGLFSGSEYFYAPEFKEGSNKYRVKYEQFDPQRTLFSEEVEFVYYPEPIKIYPTTVTDKLYLSRVAEYEITKPDGSTVTSGKGKVIELKFLRRGEYYITVEEQVEKFVKK